MLGGSLEGVLHPIPGTVKLLLPPRQSRGVSCFGLGSGRIERGYYEIDNLQNPLFHDPGIFGQDR